jgi:hypothetical protein
MVHFLETAVMRGGMMSGDGIAAGVLRGQVVLGMTVGHWIVLLSLTGEH